jgi:hypothetical protein
MDEDAEREASAYVQTAMSFAGFATYTPRLTVVAAATRPRLESVAPAPQSHADAEPARVHALPVIPIGLPEGATLPPISEPSAIIAPLPARAPSALVTPVPPAGEPHAVDAARFTGARSASGARSNVAIVLGLCFLVFGVALTRRRLRRSWSRA